MHTIKGHLSSIISPGVTHQENLPVLSVENLTVHYNQTIALDTISFQLNRGEQIAVIGPNGAGKSTLLKAITGLIPRTTGSITIYGHEPGSHICIAYVPQRSQVDWSFPVNVYDVVMMGRTRKIGLFKWPRRRDHDMVTRCLELVGITDMAHRQIGALSGGQQQRVFIARALAQEAQLMLMDEPLTGLDVTSQTDIFRLINDLRHQQVTVMVSIHDLNQAAEYFDRVILLHKKLLGIGTVQDVFTIDNLKHAYGSNIRILNNGTNVLVDTCCQGCHDT